MEEHVLFSIHTLHIPSHKWVLNDEGLVDFRGDLITPREAFERFIVEYPMFTIARADVSVRTMVPNGIYSYTWREVERFL